MDPEENRKAPTNLREYFEATREAGAVFRWMYDNLVSPQSMRWIQKMAIGNVLMIIMQTIQPFTISYIFNGLTIRDQNMAKTGLGAFLVTLLLQKGFQWYNDKCREWVFGFHFAKVDDVVTRLFNEKSLAQHEREANLLSPTVMDKGRAQIMNLQRVMLFDAMLTILQLVFAFICLWFLSALSGVIMTTVILAYLVWSLYLNSKVGMVYTPIDREFRRLARVRHERMVMIERVKVTAMEDRESDEIASSFRNTLTDDRRFWHWFVDVAFSRSLLNALGLISIMAWGLHLAWKGEISIGLLYPLFMWAMRVSENIWRLGEVEHQINWNIPPVQSMIKAVSLTAEIADGPDAVDIDPNIAYPIVFKNVGHTYLSGSIGKNLPPAVQDVSFEIKPGEKVALIGSSGAGKSTLMKMLLRFDDPTSGSIWINGYNLKDIKQHSWLRYLGYIAQREQVLDGTIRYNLTFALSTEERFKITDEELWRLMKPLQIDFGERLTDGLDTVVGRNGIKLSGGQAQRLMIGAAIIKNPRLLVIDEATSSLDSSTEKLVQQGLTEVLSGGNTSALIVAHRLSTVRNLCDKFVVLRAVSDLKPGESQVEAIADSFEELYRISPTFRKLADDQEIEIEEELVA